MEGGSTRHSLQVVELSQTAVQIVSILHNLPVFGQAGHADLLDGWRCFLQKRVMSRLIQVRQHQTNESVFVISSINKYMLGSRYPYGATGLNTGCTSDA